MIRPALLLVLFGVLPSVAFAQEGDPIGVVGRAGDAVTNAGYAYFFEPGEPTVRVQLWGDVPAPGLYEVAAGTDLRSIVTLAGGPTYNQDEGRLQRIEVLIYREVGGERVVASRFDLDTVIESPTIVLLEGDTVVVRSFVKERFNYLSVLTIAGSVAAVLLSIDRLLETTGSGGN